MNEMGRLLLAHEELPYEIAEEIKTLRTNILFSGDDKRVIMITSCKSGEGKSSVILELARSMAELGKNVLLVDADLRKSVVKEKVKEGRIRYGLTHYLCGQASAQEALYATESDGVYLMPAGAMPPNPTELLSNVRMKSLLEATRQNFDYVLVDCAPLGMVVDAAVVAPFCDGSMMLIEAGQISYRYAQDVLNQLKATQSPILGVVLNKVDYAKSKHYGRYGKYYGKYSKYEKYYKSE